MSGLDFQSIERMHWHKIARRRWWPRQHARLPLQRLPQSHRHDVRIERTFHCKTLNLAPKIANDNNIHPQLSVKDSSLLHTRGQDKLTSYSTSVTIGTGNTMTSPFCSVCGTLMYRRSSGFSSLSFCRIGTVDDLMLHEMKLRPQTEQFVESRVAWLEGVEGVRQVGGMSTKWEWDGMGGMVGG
jgi:hypothetical protein